MIRRKPSRLNDTIVSESKQDRATPAKGIREDVPPTDLSAMSDVVNMDVAKDGSLKLRKPLEQTFSGNGDCFPLGDGKTLLTFRRSSYTYPTIPMNARKHYTLTTFYITAPNGGQEAAYIMYVDDDGNRVYTTNLVSRNVTDGVDYDATRFIEDLPEAMLVGQTSVFAASMDLRAVPNAVSKDVISDDGASDLKRYVRIYKGTIPYDAVRIDPVGGDVEYGDAPKDEVWIIEIMRPEPNDITPDESDMRDNVNLTLDDPSSLRDRYDSGAAAVDGILAYIDKNALVGATSSRTTISRGTVSMHAFDALIGVRIGNGGVAVYAKQTICFMKPDPNGFMAKSADGITADALKQLSDVLYFDPNGVADMSLDLEMYNDHGLNVFGKLKSAKRLPWVIPAGTCLAEFDTRGIPANEEIEDVDMTASLTLHARSTGSDGPWKLYVYDGKTSLEDLCKSDPVEITLGGDVWSDFTVGNWHVYFPMALSKDDALPGKYTSLNAEPYVDFETGDIRVRTTRSIGSDTRICVCVTNSPITSDEDAFSASYPLSDKAFDEMRLTNGILSADFRYWIFTISGMSPEIGSDLDMTVAQLTERVDDKEYVILESLGTNDSSNANIVLKAFVHSIDASNDWHYCVWEMSKDGVAWEEVPEFVDRWRDKLVDIPVVDYTDSKESLTEAAKYTRTVRMAPFYAASRKDSADDRPDVLVLRRDFANRRIRFSVYRYAPLNPERKTVQDSACRITFTHDNAPGIAGSEIFKMNGVYSWSTPLMYTDYNRAIDRTGGPTQTALDDYADFAANADTLRLYVNASVSGVSALAHYSCKSWESTDYDGTLTLTFSQSIFGSRADIDMKSMYPNDGRCGSLYVTIEVFASDSTKRVLKLHYDLTRPLNVLGCAETNAHASTYTYEDISGTIDRFKLSDASKLTFSANHSLSSLKVSVLEDTFTLDVCNPKLTDVSPIVEYADDPDPDTVADVVAIITGILTLSNIPTLINAALAYAITDGWPETPPEMREIPKSEYYDRIRSSILATHTLQGPFLSESDLSEWDSMKDVSYTSPELVLDNNNTRVIFTMMHSKVRAKVRNVSNMPVPLYIHSLFADTVDSPERFRILGNGTDDMRLVSVTANIWSEDGKTRLAGRSQWLKSYSENVDNRLLSNFTWPKRCPAAMIPPNSTVVVTIEAYYTFLVMPEKTFTVEEMYLLGKPMFVASTSEGMLGVLTTHVFAHDVLGSHGLSKFMLDDGISEALPVVYSDAYMPYTRSLNWASVVQSRHTMKDVYSEAAEGMPSKATKLSSVTYLAETSQVTVTLSDELTSIKVVDPNNRMAFHDGRIFTYGVKDNLGTLFISDANSFITRALSAMDFDDEVTAVVPWRTYTLVFTDRSIYTLTGNSDGTYSKRLLTNTIGLPKADARTPVGLLNAVMFKSGSKVYRIIPNIYNATDMLTNITCVSAPIESKLEGSEGVEYLGYVTDDTYYLVPKDNAAARAFAYDHLRKIWTSRTYPVNISRIVENTVDDVRAERIDADEGILAGIYLLDSNSAFGGTDAYGDLLMDDSEDLHAQPFRFVADFGERSSEYNRLKQFLATDVNVGVLNVENDPTKAMIPLEVSIRTDGSPNPTHIDQNTSAALLKKSAEQVLTLGAYVPTVSSENGYSGYPGGALQAKLFIKHSGRGRTFRVAIYGDSNKQFKLCSVEERWRQLPNKQ